MNLYIDGHREIFEKNLTYEKENKIKIFEKALEIIVRRCGDIQKIETFLSLGEEDSKNRILNLGLTHSAAPSSIPLIQFFLDKGADINYINMKEKNFGPLHEALVNKREDIFQFLLDNKADPRNVSFISWVPWRPVFKWLNNQVQKQTNS